VTADRGEANRIPSKIEAEVRARSQSRVLLIGGERVSSLGLRAAVLASDSLWLVEEITDESEAVAAAKRHQPNHILIAAEGVSGADIALLGKLRSTSPGSTFTVCPNQVDREALVALWRVPVGGILAWADITAEVLQETLTVAGLGMCVMSPAVIAAMLNTMADGAEDSRSERKAGFTGLHLTSRQGAVLSRLRKGCRQQQIAEELNLHLRTVQGICRDLKTKAGAETTAELVDRTRDIGLPE
jgi:DNA-binding NarL/FixJ family response regulator